MAALPRPSGADMVGSARETSTSRGNAVAIRNSIQHGTCLPTACVEISTLAASLRDASHYIST
eukprot:6216886-Prymnesium_polylepis.1